MEEKSIVAYNAWDEFYKTPFGAVKAGEEIRVRIRVLREANPSGAVLKLRRDGESAERTVELLPDKEQDSTYTGAFSVEETGLWFYRFEISVPEGLLFVGQGEDAKAKVEDFLPEWQLTVYDPAFSVPEWLKGGILYQIFPDRFFKSRSGELPPVRNERTLHANWQERPLFKQDEENYAATDFFGGDLEGIREKLPYLKSLGVTALYLNPVFEAASNHRYNTGDYLAVDPWLGEEGDLIRLFDEAREMGIRVILDGVFSHTGSDSRYFNKDGHYDSLGAWQSPESPYAAWYRFKDKERKEYDCWWGIPTLPNVNEEEPSFEKFICGEGGVLDYWIERGAGGWRLDVADELPGDFIEGIRSAIDAEKPGAYLLGEVWEDGSNKIAYSQRRRYLLGRQVHGLMNYPFRTALLNWLAGGDAAVFRDSMETIRENYPPFAFYGAMNFLGTHDTARILTLLGTEGTPKTKAERAAYRLSPTELARGLAKLRLAGMLLYSFPGSPTLFYGDEAGVQGFEDPLNRGAFPWGSEDAALTDFFRTLGQLRRTRESLRSGALRYLLARGGALAIEREHGGERTVTALNAGDAPADLTLAWDAPTAQDAMTGQRFLVIDGKAHLTLPPLDGVILV